MKSNIIALPSIKDDTYIQLETYRDLDRQIKALTKERDKLKELLIKGHFKHNDEFIKDGRLLATYYTQERITLDQKKLSSELPELVKDYQVINAVRTFLLK